MPDINKVETEELTLMSNAQFSDSLQWTLEIPAIKIGHSKFVIFGISIIYQRQMK